MPENVTNESTPEPKKLLLGVRDVAKTLGVSDRLARGLMTSGVIPCRMFGTERRTSMKALEAFVEKLFDERFSGDLQEILVEVYGSTHEISRLLTNTTTKKHW